MPRENILILSQYFPPETGAAQTRWQELSKRWSSRAHVTVITSAPDYPEGELYDGYDNEWLHYEEHGDVDVYYTKTITSPSGNLIRRGLKFVWFMIIATIIGLRYTTPTVVIATSPQPLTGISAFIIAQLRGATFVFEVRDLWPESIIAVSDFDNKFVIWMLDRTVELLYRQADQIVVVSQAFIEPIADRGIDQSKIAYHPNGIDMEFYRSKSETSSAIENLDDQFIVSYVGTIGRAHGLSIVMEAAPDLQGVKFVLVGDGAKREELEAQSTNYENITFTGRRPKSEIPAILRESNVALVHLKPHKVFETVVPSKLLEAMAAGLPVVLGVRGEAERILTQAEAGVVIEPGDADELVEAVRFLRDNPTERKRFTQSGQAYVNEEFNWESIAEEYFETVTKAEVS